jgi:hypothetical protein
LPSPVAAVMNGDFLFLIIYGDGGNQIKSRYMFGGKTADLAKEFKVSIRTVRKALKSEVLANSHAKKGDFITCCYYVII